MILEKMKSCLWKVELWFWTYSWTLLLGPSGPTVVSRPQAPRSINYLTFQNFIGFILWFLKKMRSCLWILEPESCTYGWIRLLGPSRPNVVPRPQAPKANKFFEVSKFKWSFLIILEKMRSCLRKLEPGTSTCAWICLLGPSEPNVVFRPQAPRSINFLRFHEFIGCIS